MQTSKHAQAAADDVTSTSSISVSRRAALALSLASAASVLLPLGAASAIVDPSAVDQNLEGGTVTLLKVKGDGREMLSLSEAVVLDTNRKVHAANGAPIDFPGFVRVGFDIKVVVPFEDDEEGEVVASEGGEGGEAMAATEAADEASTSSSSPPSTTDPGAEEQAASPAAAAPSPSSPPPRDTSIPRIKGYQITPEGLIFKDYVIGGADGDAFPQEGQEVVFDYTAFNEAGTRIDSSFTKGRPASARIGVGAGGGLIPGFELGLLGMRPGGRRRLIVPPALGPPIGPQTFFSAKQCEVFDVQLRAVKNCKRRQVAMFSDVVCE